MTKSAVNKLFKGIGLLLKCRKFTFSPPPKTKTLIYDRAGSELFLEYLDAATVHILDTRGESINIYVLLMSFLQRQDYRLQYIKAVSPLFCLTTIDSNPRFYCIKKTFPDLVTIFVQNGRRTKNGDIFGILERSTRDSNYQVDYMLVFGAAVGRKYKEFIQGDYIQIGSMKNNLFEVPSLKKNRMTFVSCLCTYDFSTFLHDTQRYAYWNEYHQAEHFLLPIIKRFCNSQNIELCVVGCNLQDQAVERKMLENILGEDGWRFAPKTSNSSSYEFACASKYVVGIDSTLLYEAASRGIKAGFFSCRTAFLSELGEYETFGWPAQVDRSGPFWSSTPSEAEVLRILDYLVTVDESEWLKTMGKTLPNIMYYDPGNKIFIKLMQQLEIPLKGGISDV